MRDQAQVQSYCRADPLLLWARVRASRITQGPSLKFADVHLVFRALSREPRPYHMSNLKGLAP